MPKRLIAWLAGTALVLFLIGIALGSEGKTDGETTTAQQVSNVAFPVAVLLALIVIVILAVSAIRLGRRSRTGI